MANRRYRSQFRQSWLGQSVDIYCRFAVGATGAPTLTSANSTGVVSVTRNSAGKYTVLFQDSYAALYGAMATIKLASGAPITASSAMMVVRADNSASATKTVVVEFLQSDGTAAEIVSGATVYLHFEFNNSSQN
jgi:hypothetical protein